MFVISFLHVSQNCKWSNATKSFMFWTFNVFKNETIWKWNFSTISINFLYCWVYDNFSLNQLNSIFLCECYLVFRIKLQCDMPYQETTDSTLFNIYVVCVCICDEYFSKHELWNNLIFLDSFLLPTYISSLGIKIHQTTNISTRDDAHINVKWFVTRRTSHGYVL